VARELGYRHVVAEALGRAVVRPEPEVVSRRDPERRKGTGDWCLAVLSRLPLAAPSTHWLPQLPTDPAARAVLRADVDVDGRSLVVCGTHLPHLEMGAPLATRALRRSLPDPSSEAAVLLGDMNMWRWCIGPMAGRGWSLHGRGATFPSSRPLFRIDHLLTTRAVEVLDVEVVPDLGSDHRPVRARIRVGP
jgi:endonuclease/exonuclease/phosphatase family metal-dependent hydrolase